MSISSIGSKRRADDFESCARPSSSSSESESLSRSVSIDSHVNKRRGMSPVVIENAINMGERNNVVLSDKDRLEFTDIAPKVGSECHGSDTTSNDAESNLLLTPQQLEAKMMREGKLYSYITGTPLPVLLPVGARPIDALVDLVPEAAEGDPKVTLQTIKQLSYAPAIGVQPFNNEVTMFRENFARTFAFGVSPYLLLLPLN
jgi:hypothetical protein